MTTMLSVFTEAVLLRWRDGVSTDNIAKHLNDKYGTAFSGHIVDAFTNKAAIKRKHPYLIHELKNMGYKAQFTADLLGINVQTVYYHQRKFPQKVFCIPNIYLHSGKLEPVFKPDFEAWERSMRITSYN